jgi:hypothetical protein
MNINARFQGNVGLADAIAFFEKQGIRVLLPLTDCLKYDLVIDNKGKLERVQVKTSSYRRGQCYEVMIKTCGGNRTGSGVYHPFDASIIDWLYVLTLPEEIKYLIPASVIEAKHTLTLGQKWSEYIV